MKPLRLSFLLGLLLPGLLQAAEVRVPAGTRVILETQEHLIGRGDLVKLGQLIRSYFKLGGHHIQFNIVDTATLKAAQKCPEDYKDLLVRMAGYSDYFNDMNADLQQEIIERTENEAL